MKNVVIMLSLKEMCGSTSASNNAIKRYIFKTC